jgi:hypothetical protein
MNKEIESKAINSIRILSADGIQKANSGHPGLPLGAAPAAYTLWSKFLHFDPTHLQWENRDRFVLSAGHGSMLLYSLLHLFSCGLKKEDLMSFRQMGSLTPGHPEYGHTMGVDATTGPLGAGLAMAVGFAMAESHLAAEFNKEGLALVDHRTYALCGDGCLMEGISSEALSLAGTLNLHKLTILYDSNHISIEGNTEIAFTENVEKRMEAFGFKTLTVEDGNDVEAISYALKKAEEDTTAPYFITIKTEIGYGVPNKQGKASAHGEPLGEENIKEMRAFLHWEYEEAFYIPEEVYAHYQSLVEEKKKSYIAWKAVLEEYAQNYPDDYEKYLSYHDKQKVLDLLHDKALWEKAEKAEATRNSSGEILQMVKDRVPNLFGGSADLAPSTKTEMKGEGFFSKDNRLGKNIHFGVRELAMAGIANGILLHGGYRSYASTFFVFSDYIKPMARLAALMKLPQIYILTHDSIGVGEDGPTHEPIEQLAMLRSTPNFRVFRPADRQETAAAWFSALSSTDCPTAIVLSRQNLPQLCQDGKEALKGAYILSDSEKTPELIFIATGSELELAEKAGEVLRGEGKAVRVVSMPSMEIFEMQSEEYKEKILPSSVEKRISVEALSSFGWGKYVGLKGASLSMDSFGASAPAKELFTHFGFTVENLLKLARSL